MIAISYRREDSTSIAGRLHDRLRAEFGQENVFMDFDSIPYGVDFRDHIAQTLEAADVLVAVIGPGWLGHRPGESTRRVDDATDFVRLEVGGALRRGIPVIPVLVDKTVMPVEDGLPDDLKSLVFRNALMLDSGIDFHHHADRLITGIHRLLKNLQSAPHPGSKEQSRSSSASARDLDDRRAARSRFKWSGVLDRFRSPPPLRQQKHETGVKPTSPASTAEPVSAAPKETSTNSGGTEARVRQPASHPAPAGLTFAERVAALSETSELIERDLDFERYGGGANARSEKQSAPMADSAPTLARPVKAPAMPDEESSIMPPPTAATRKEISAQTSGTKAGASEIAPSDTNQLIAEDPDFKRYGGGTQQSTTEQSAPLTGSTPKLASPVTAPVLSVQESSIARPPARLTIEQRSGARKEPRNLSLKGKLLWLVLAGAFIGFVTYFVVTSKTKSPSTRTEAVPTPQSSPLITPDVALAVSTAAQPSVQPLASETPLELSSPSPPGGVNDRQTTADNRAIARSGNVEVRAVMSTGRGGEPATSFTTDTPKLFALLKTTGIKNGDKLRGVLVEEDVGDVVPANTKFFESTMTLQKDTDDAYYYFNKPTKGWPVGKYRVEIYVNDDLAKTVKFTIEASVATNVLPSLSSTPAITGPTESNIPATSPTPGTTANPPVEKGRTWQDQISDFVRQFIAANQQQDANATVDFYAPSVDYFASRAKDHAYILRDVQKYNVQWPARHDSIDGDVQVDEKVPNQQYRANFKLNLYAEDPKANDWSKGQVAMTLDINIVDGVPKIAAINQKRLQHQNGRGKGPRPADMPPPEPPGPIKPTKLTKVLIKKYGFSSLLPPELFPDAEAKLADGTTDRLTSLKRCANVAFSAPHETVQKVFDDFVNQFHSAPERRIIDYKVVKETWFVVSGSTGKTGYYVKGVKHGDDVFVMELDYVGAVCRIPASMLAEISHGFNGN